MLLPVYLLMILFVVVFVLGAARILSTRKRHQPYPPRHTHHRSRHDHRSHHSHDDDDRHQFSTWPGSHGIVSGSSSAWDSTPGDSWDRSGSWSGSDNTDSSTSWGGGSSDSGGWGSGSSDSGGWGSSDSSSSSDSSDSSSSSSSSD